jgi:hypothetical protein
MPRLWIERDAPSSCQYFNEESIAEPKGLLIVPVDSLVEFDLRDVEEPNSHDRYLAMISLRSFAASSPRR